VSLTPGPDAVGCRLSLRDLRDLPVAVARCRSLLDLDADPVAVDAALAADPLLAPLVDAAPGRRVPRTVDGAELALRAVLGQQVSTAAARTHAGRLVEAAGEPVDDPAGGLTALFPTPAAVAAVDPSVLAMPATRRATVLRLAEALAAGDVDLSPGADRSAARAALLALPGIGPVDGRDRRHAGARRPGRVPAVRPRRQVRRPRPGHRRRRRAVPPLGAVAVLRRAAPVGHRHPRRQPPARGGRMTQP
jgi:AraC family transcriptional regulator of adaptative response / DNA-3-methyladenine glycosylase II